MAQQSNISKQDWIARELCIRFEDKPRICEKKNDTDIGFNQRIVNVHNQTLSYYHLIQEFTDLDVGKLGSAIPKAGVKLRDIQNLSFPPKRKKDKNYFTISFPKNKILKYGKNNYEIIIDPDAKGLQEWTFEFKYDIVVLPQIQQRIREEKKKIQQNMQKKMEEQNKRKQQLRQQQEGALLNEKQKIQYQNYLNERHLESQQQQYNRKQQREKRRAQYERMNIGQKDQKQEPFDQHFNNQYVKTCLKMPLNELLQVEYNILKIIGDFRMKSIETVKFLVNRFLSEKETAKYRIEGVNSNKFKKQNIIVKIGNKDINQEFLSLSTVADVLSVLYRNNQEHKMRVPLACFVKYRNYKCICICEYLNDGDNDQIIYGLQDEGSIKINSLVSQRLKVVSKQLNLKPYQTELNQTKQMIFLDPECRVYKNKTSKTSFQYITNIREIFPIDVDLQRNVDQRTIRMRPEFVNSAQNEQPLSGGAFLYSVDDPDGEEEDVQVGKASYLLSHKTLPNFVQKLNNLDILLLDSPNIAQALQKNGINVRYIGKIAKLTYLPYVKELMEVEGIARTIKVLFRKQVRQYSQSTTIAQFQANNPYNKYDVTKQFVDSFDQVSRQVVIDFLNLIFSNTSDTRSYWESFIKPLCYQKYEFQIKVFPQVCLGALLHAVLYHCGIKVKFDIGIKLFNTAEPFKTSDWVQYTVFSKVYEYPSFQIQKLAKKSTQYKNNDQKQMAVKCLDLQLLVQRALRSSQNFQHCALPEQRILVQLSKLIQIKTSDFPIHHPSMLQYILSNVSEKNFVKANNIAEFSLPPTHPLFISFYMAFSKIYDKKILHKSSAIVAYRSLGPQHHQTCQLLAQTQTDDVQILKKAWVEGGKTNQNMILIITKKLQSIGKIQQCMQFCKKGIEKLDTPSLKNYKALIQLSLRSIKVCYLTRNLTQMLYSINHLWKVLQQFDNKNEDVYYEMLEYTLKMLLEKHVQKSFLYKLVLIIGDRILKAKYQQQINEGNVIPYSLMQLKMAANDNESDFFTRVGPEQRGVIINDIIKFSRKSKSHVHWLQYTLSQLSTAHNNLNYRNDLFTNFDQIVASLQNQDFDEGMQSLQSLCKLFGQKLFYNALMKDIFCQAT